MFGSKNLLIAFVIGGVGISSIYIGVSEVEGLKIGQFAVGICLLWVSSLFGSFLAGCEVGKATTKNDEGS